ncbi:MAG TPA: recombination regulator RecX [Pseudogracilibacillus sp.]|nr:recombination regulator RecX [Pseudogracilibacillus sp.]
MRTITKVEQQKKNKRRYNIYLDGQFAFGVDEDIFIEHYLRKGMELSEEEIEQLLDEESIQKAYTLAVRYLSYRIRSIQEMEDYLIKQEVDQIVLQRVIVRLLEEKLLDDALFAQSFVADRKLLTSKGPTVIKRELMQKGIDEQIAHDAAYTYTFDEQVEKAEKWAQVQWKRRSKHPARKKREQIRVKLIQKGFTKDVIDAVIEQLHTDDLVQTDSDIITKQADKLLTKYKRKYDGYELKMRVKSALYQRGFPQDAINEYMENLNESM